MCSLARSAIFFVAAALVSAGSPRADTAASGPGTRYGYEVETGGERHAIDLVLLPSRGATAIAVLSMGDESLEFRVRPSRLAEDLAAALWLDGLGAVDRAEEHGSRPIDSARRTRPSPFDARAFASPAVVLARVRAGFPDRWAGLPFEPGSRLQHRGIGVDVVGRCEVAGRRGTELELSGAPAMQGRACFAPDLALPLTADLRGRDGETWRARLTAVRTFDPGPPPVAGTWADPNGRRPGYILRPDGTVGHFLWPSKAPAADSFCHTELSAVWRWDGARVLLGQAEPGRRASPIWVAWHVGDGAGARLRAAPQWQAKGVEVALERIGARSRGLCEGDLRRPSVHDRLARGPLPGDVDLEARDDLGETPLTWAARRGDARLVGELLRRGATMDVRNAMRRGPVSSAAHGGHEDVLRLLLRREPASDEEREDRDLALGLAAASGRLDLMELLLRRGARPGGCERHPPSSELGLSCTPPLSHAARGGHVAAVSLLLERGANPRWAPGANDHPAALGMAAAGGHDDVVALLLARSEPPGKVWKSDDWPPLVRARINRHPRVMARIARALGIDVRLTALRCDGELLRALVAFGNLPRHAGRAVDDRGRPLLRHAIDCRDPAVVEALLDVGADPNVAGLVGGLPLVAAIDVGFRDAFELLLARGARPGPQVVVGMGGAVTISPVEVAIEENRRDFYELLVRAGAPAHPARPVGPVPAPHADAIAPGPNPTSPFDAAEGPARRDP